MLGLVQPSTHLVIIGVLIRLVLTMVAIYDDRFPVQGMINLSKLEILLPEQPELQLPLIMLEMYISLVLPSLDLRKMSIHMEIHSGNRQKS